MAGIERHWWENNTEIMLRADCDSIGCQESTLHIFDRKRLVYTCTNCGHHHITLGEVEEPRPGSFIYFQSPQDEEGHKRVIS